MSGSTDRIRYWKGIVVNLPADYAERVYAGVLGKIIGVYLGRPFEGWTYERIKEELGEIWYYVNQQRDNPLIVTDDDISGTFTFLRALPDYGNSLSLTPEQIGQTWLNYIIERRTILWWGGMGNSTEHTAYLRLKRGIKAPRSGSRELNSRVVSEQIGSQIFIDGWAMVAPGNPELAADLARRAASVSHDGEAIYGAQVIAAMEAQAFVESDIDRLLDTAVSLIPQDSLTYRMIADIRNWHADAGDDWRKTWAHLQANYGYDKYGGTCHIIPNHGLIIQSLLHGQGDFQKSLMIVNTCGWDTDCNSGNLGCLLGIRQGLATFDGGPDWRGPIADRLYLPTADGGRAVSDALTEAYHIVAIGERLAGAPHVAPKNGARFHFSQPGAIQGFTPDTTPETNGAAHVAWCPTHSRLGVGSLAVHYHGIAPGRRARVTSPVFIPSRQEGDYFAERGYALHASPALYSGQTVRAGVWADEANASNVTARLCVTCYRADDTLAQLYGPTKVLEPGDYAELTWQIPTTDGLPISAVGIELPEAAMSNGIVYLDYLGWDGMPSLRLGNPGGSGYMWRKAWVDGVDQFEWWWPDTYRLAQNEGRGLLSQGARDWTDYSVEADLQIHLARTAGIAIRYQGMRRFYTLLLCDDGKARLVKALDGDAILAEVEYPWEYATTHNFRLSAQGAHLDAWIDGQHLFSVDDDGAPLEGGGAALVIEEGRITCNEVLIMPC